jgi:CO/xanthine dehydrogenase FAD-binding subunit
MIPFSYLRALDEQRAFAALREADTSAIAGGTTLVDLMRLHVMRPSRVVDITHLPFDRIEALADGAIRIGALVRNADRRALSGAVGGAARRRFAAGAQHGDDRGQSDATHTVPLFP